MILVVPSISIIYFTYIYFIKMLSFLILLANCIFHSLPSSCCLHIVPTSPIPYPLHGESTSSSTLLWGGTTALRNISCQKARTDSMVNTDLTASGPTVCSSCLYYHHYLSGPESARPMYLFLWKLSTVEMSFSAAITSELLMVLTTEKATIFFGVVFSQMYFILLCGGTECFLLELMT